MAWALKLKSLSITIAASNVTFSIALVEGVEPAALQQAVAARTCCSPNRFFLTLASPDGVVVPLSSALPDGLELTLHYVKSGSAVSSRKGRQKNMYQMAESSGDEELGAQPRGGCGHDSSPPHVNVERDEQSDHVARVSHIELEPSLENEESKFHLPGYLSVSCGALSCQSCDSTDRANERVELLRDDNKTMLTALDRFSRLTTDLANERTLLAWFRTSLASMRTAFSFFSVSGTTPGSAATVFFAQSAMVTLILVFCSTGFMRIRRSRTPSSKRYRQDCLAEFLSDTRMLSSSWHPWR